MNDPYRLIIAPKAAVDLGDIHDEIAKTSPQNATAVANRIMDALAKIQDIPHRAVVSSESPDVRFPVRSVAVRPYIVFFRAIDDDKVVRVLRIRHGARRPLRRFE